jgi:hypothetical protein
MNITAQRTPMVCVLAGALALIVALLVLVPKAASAEPPEPIDFPPEELVGFCDFPVLFEVSGKTKVIELPNGDVLFKNPGVRVTLTNLDEPTNKVTYVSTGTTRLRELEGGDLRLITTGRSVLFNESIGILVTIGRFTTIFDEEDGDLSYPTGKGRIIDACARLA